MATGNPPNRLAEIAGLRKMTEPPQTPYERFLAAAKIGNSYYVRATLPDGTVDRIKVDILTWGRDYHLPFCCSNFQTGRTQDLNIFVC